MVSHTRVLGLVILTSAGCTSSAPPPDADDSPPPTVVERTEPAACQGAKRVRVLDAQGEPLAGVRVHAMVSWLHRGRVASRKRSRTVFGEDAHTGLDGWAIVCPPEKPEPTALTTTVGGAWTVMAEVPGWARVQGTTDTLVLGPPRGVWLKLQTGCESGGDDVGVQSEASPDRPQVHEPDNGWVRLSGLGPVEYDVTVECRGSVTRAVIDGRNIDGPVVLGGVGAPT